MNKTKAWPADKTWTTEYKYTTAEQKEILKVLYRKVERDLDSKAIINRLQRETMFLHTAYSDENNPTVKNITAKQYDLLEQTCKKFIIQLKNIDQSALTCVDDELFDTSPYHNELYNSAVLNRLVVKGAKVDVMQSIQRLCEMSEGLMPILKMASEQTERGRPIDEPLQYTVYRLVEIYGDITSDYKIGENGVLQEFIEKSIRPFSKSYAVGRISSILRSLKNKEKL